MLERKEEKVEEKIAIARYDRLLYEYVSAHSVVAWQKMNTDYTRITRLLIEDILQLGSVMEPSINQQLISYFKDSVLIQLFDDVEEKYRNLDFLEKQLAGSFRQLKKEIPSLTVSRIYTQVSALNESIIVEDSLIGISLDKYMGRDYPLYRDYYYDYQCRTMTPDRIAPDCLSFYLQYEYPFGFMTRPSLLNVILYFGKIHYIVSRVLGYNSMEEELGYTPEEIKWCRKNKNLVWERMVARGHLRSTDPMIVRSYTRPSPQPVHFSGEEAPPFIGIWMGARIIESYMKNNRKVTFRQLLEDKDYLRILHESGFSTALDH